MVDRARQESIWTHYHSRLLVQDQEALSSLYDEASSLVYSICLRILGSEADAQEITLDVFTQLWKNPTAWDASRGSFTSWIVLLARSRSLDRVRRRKVRDKLGGSDALDLDLPDQAASPELQLATLERSQRMRALLTKLPAPQRHAIELAFYKDRTHQEIAEILGEPLGTIKSRIRSAMLKLKELLKDSHLEEVCE